MVLGQGVVVEEVEFPSLLQQKNNWVWGCMPVIPATTGSLKLGGSHTVQAGLGKNQDLTPK
jgi:hypothetical protein